MALNLEGLIRLFTSIVPNNLNPKQWIVRNFDVQGAAQNFAELQELIDFHPFKMKRGMRATVQNFPSAGKSTDFKLVYDPAFMVDSNEGTIVTVNNYATFWQEIETTTPESVRVYEYAPDGPNGGSPIYPYTLSEEDKWEPEFDAQKNHRWLRFRDDDVDSNADGIFDNWTVPISLNSYTSGDYVENRFQRYALSKPDQNLTVVGDLENGRHYLIVQGSIDVDGEILEKGRRFTYSTALTYTFEGGTIVRETNIAPPRVDSNGNPNNEPLGWADLPPNGTDTLWMIVAQKSVYGQLKTPWSIRKVQETPEYVRYNYVADPNPNELCATNESAAVGTQADTDLNDAGWVKTYVDHTFMAIREDTETPGIYTAWQIEKISGESGEYIDRVFKLFPINADPDSPSVQAPSTRDPLNEGWSDNPLVEGSTTINFISEARKFFDGTLKTPWSDPVPYTGKSTYQDIITADPGDEFKINPNTVPATVVPSLITLENRIFKGVDKIWEQAGVTITFAWYRVYNDGTVFPADANSEPTSITGFDYLPATGTPGTLGYKFDNQRVTINKDVVTGKAVFRCVATLQTGGDDIIFEEEISILDISDGLDAKNLSVTADNQLLIYDTSNTVFVPANIILRAYYSNLGSPTLNWYHWNGVSWDALTTGDTYNATAATYFTADGSAEEARFAVSTHPTNPDLADGEVFFTDTITIGKTSAAGIGSPGENAVIALLDNESHTVVVDNTTGQPFAGEIGVSGKAITKVEVWNGATKLSIGTSGTDVIQSISSDNPNIGFTQQFGTQGTDPEKYGEVYVSSWAANETSAVCTITLTYGGRVYTKQFSISSTKDAPGAIILDIDSDSGFEWTPSQRGNKTVTGNLYDSNVLQTSGYEYRWLLNGATSLGSRSSYATGNRQITLTRTEVGSSADITCQVREVGQVPILRSRTVKFTDVLDNQRYIAWTDSESVTNANKIADGVDPTTLPETVGSVTWRLSTDSYWQSNSPVYACDAEETTVEWVWTYPYRIKGEKGDQGPNADYFFSMFKAGGTTVPSSTATIAVMYANGWRRIPPTTGIVYQTIGRFSGEDTPIGADGYPWDDAATSASNSIAQPEDTWSTPVKLTGTDGTDGDPGTAGSDGDNGWSPVFAVATDGERRVLRVVDWQGGEGTKPATGLYLSSSGFTSNIASAVDIRGTAGPAGADGVDGVDGVALGVEEVFAGKKTYVTGTDLSSLFTTIFTRDLGSIKSNYIDFMISCLTYGNDNRDFEVRIQTSINGSTYNTVRTLSFNHDVACSSAEPLSKTVRTNINVGPRYVRIQMRKLSGGDNRLSEVSYQFTRYNLDYVTH